MNSPIIRFIAAFAVLILLTFPAAAEEPGPNFKDVLPGRSLEFPRDHGAHPEYKTEWWYFTGHLQTSGQSFGFELTFFRIGVRPSLITKSAWESDSIYLAHFAVTDDAHNKFFYADQISRGVFGEAGAAKDSLSVWLKDWSAKSNGDGIELSAKSGGYELALQLRPGKPLVLQGDHGYSQKGAEPGDASYYTSYTRLNGRGSLRVAGRTIEIPEASVWMDHEFSSSSLSREKIGWDWFALQFDNGEELMLYQLRGSDGSPTQFSSGTFVAKDGTGTKLLKSDFQITPLDRWVSPATSIRYPAKWKIEVPKLALVAEVVPTVADQELKTGGSTSVNYWEGRSRVHGTRISEKLTGNAYVELVGYKHE